MEMLSAILIFEKDEKRDFSPRKNNPTRVDNLISYVGNICLTKLLLDVYSLNVIFAEHNHFRYRKYNYGTGLEKNNRLSTHFRLPEVLDRATTCCRPGDNILFPSTLYMFVLFTRFIPR
jgi:hypothetical protein